MMHVILFGEAERLGIAALAAFAARLENHYDPASASASVPGDDTRFRVRLGLFEEFRCVFSWTRFPEPHGLCRHLSISLPNAYPLPAVVIEIAKLFGFTKALAMNFCDAQFCPTPCIVVVEPISIEERTAHGTH